MEKIKTEKLEREYTIPLRKKCNKVPSYKKANKAIRTIKEFLAKHMKVADRDLDSVKIDKYLNEMIWHRGIKSPPAKIKVKATKENGIVTVEAAEMSTNLKFKKLRAEKVENQSKEVAKKKKSSSEQVQASSAKDVRREKVETPEEAKTEEQKVEEKEDKKSTIEGEEKIEKALAKEEKHTTNEKSPKEKKNMKVGYNRSGQGQ